MCKVFEINDKCIQSILSTLKIDFNFFTLLIVQLTKIRVEVSFLPTFVKIDVNIISEKIRVISCLYKLSIFVRVPIAHAYYLQFS